MSLSGALQKANTSIRSVQPYHRRLGILRFETASFFCLSILVFNIGRLFMEKALILRA